MHDAHIEYMKWRKEQPIERITDNIPSQRKYGPNTESKNYGQQSRYRPY